MPSVSFNTQFRISRFAVESGADGVDRVRLAVEDIAKVFVLHMENMRNNKLKTKTRPSDIIEAKAVLYHKKVTGRQCAILFQHFVKSILNFR